MEIKDVLHNEGHWNECQLISILKQRHNKRCFIFKNDKQKIEVIVSAEEYKEKFEYELYKNYFYDIESTQINNYTIGFSWVRSK